MANGQAYTSPTGSMRHTTRPAPHMPSPGSAAPKPLRWKNESPVSTSVPCATSQSQTSAPRPDGRSLVIRKFAPNRSAMALNASSWPTLCLVITTEILNPANPAAARFAMARSAIS